MKIYFDYIDLMVLLRDLETETLNNDMNLSFRKLKEKITVHGYFKVYANLEFTDYLLIKYVRKIHENFDFKVEFE